MFRDEIPGSFKAEYHWVLRFLLLLTLYCNTAQFPHTHHSGIHYGFLAVFQLWRLGGHSITELCIPLKVKQLKVTLHEKPEPGGKGFPVSDFPVPFALLFGQ